MKCEGAELGEMVRSECRQLALSNASLLRGLRALVPGANSIRPVGWGIFSFNESNSVLRDDRNHQTTTAVVSERPAAGLLQPDSPTAIDGRIPLTKDVAERQFPE